jgi:protein-disulfide isomerase/uncharacterized membrane protein
MRATRLALSALAISAVVAAAVMGVTESPTSALVTGILAGWLVCAAALCWDLGVGVVVTMLAGMGVSLYLAHQHITVACGEASICAVNATFDCDKINTSAWSEMFGVPTALYGFGFYFAVAFATATRRLGRANLAGLPRLLLAAGVCAMGYSAFLAWVSHQLGTWCLFCISMYGFNLLLLGAAVVALRWPGVLRPGLPAPASPFGATLLGLGGDRSLSVLLTAGIAAFVLSFLVYTGQKNQMKCGGGAVDLDTLAAYYHLPAQPSIKLRGDEAVLGDPEAPYLILEWADYACPHCAHTGAEVKKLVRENPTIQLRFKDYPLSTQCNEFMEADMHPTACQAAAATVCAQRQGRFWEMSDLLFKNQNYQSVEDIRFMASQLGLDMTAVDACMADPAVRERIVDDVREADKQQVTGTPTFFIRGLFQDRWVQVRAKADAMKALVDAHRAGIALPEPKAAPARRP